MHDPDLIIRTSGEQRLSNYLMWQSAYSELVFRDELWPDFDRAAFEACLAEFSARRGASAAADGRSGAAPARRPRGSRAPARARARAASARSARGGGSELTARIVVAIPAIAFASTIIALGGIWFVARARSCSAILCLGELFDLYADVEPVRLAGFLGVAGVIVRRLRGRRLPRPAGVHGGLPGACSRSRCCSAARARSAWR